MRNPTLDAYAKNKGADQLHGISAFVFATGNSTILLLSKFEISSLLPFRDCRGRFVSDLVRNHIAVHLCESS